MSDEKAQDWHHAISSSARHAEYVADCLERIARHMHAIFGESPTVVELREHADDLHKMRTTLLQAVGEKIHGDFVQAQQNSANIMMACLEVVSRSNAS